jgi:hypothetical protein
VIQALPPGKFRRGNPNFASLCRTFGKAKL